MQQAKVGSTVPDLDLHAMPWFENTFLSFALVSRKKLL
jgi:hypothetical protein